MLTEDFGRDCPQRAKKRIHNGEAADMRAALDGRNSRQKFWSSRPPNIALH
jgi:hypothetical protein